MEPSRDGNSPREPRAPEEYLDLFRGLNKANRDFFSAAMTKSISDVAVKLHVFVDGVINKVVDNFLADLLFPHVYTVLKEKRGDNIRRVADAILGAHAALATADAASASTSTPASYTTPIFPVVPSSPSATLPTNTPRA